MSFIRLERLEDKYLKFITICTGMKKTILLSLMCVVGFTAFGQYNFKQPDFFRKYREKPLLNIPISKELHLVDFGAIPDDGKDDLHAINKALKSLSLLSKKEIGVSLVFPKGRLDLFSNIKSSHLLKLTQLKNVIIDGNGASLIIRNPEIGFLTLFKCENIIVKNLFIDYDPLPFTQGTVTKVDTIQNTFTLKIDEGFPSLSELYFERAGENWGMLMDPNIPGKLKDKVRSLYPTQKWKEMDSGFFMTQLPNKEYTKNFTIGDRYVQIARNNGKSIFHTNLSKNITFLNNTNYSSPAGTYGGNEMDEWSIIGGEILMKEGRIHSANADCIHVNGSNFGPWVENCLFEGYSDDAVNLKAAKRYILKKINDYELVVKYNVIVGDIIRVFNPREGILVGKSEVVSSTFIGDNKMHIVLKEGITSPIQVGEDKLNDIIYIDTRSCESFVFRNNTFRNARRFGMLLQSSYGIIERNVFENLSQCAISMNNGVDWGEGFVSHDIVIRNNVIKNCGYDSTFFKDYNAASIRLRITKLKNVNAKSKWKGVATAPWKGLENITITNNIFSYNKRALSIECTTNSVIKSNTFLHNNEDISKSFEIILKQNNSNLQYEE